MAKRCLWAACLVAHTRNAHAKNRTTESIFYYILMEENDESKDAKGKAGLELSMQQNSEMDMAGCGCYRYREVC